MLLDSADDYRGLRISRFGFNLVPLPNSLQLSPADIRLNNQAKGFLNTSASGYAHIRRETEGPQSADDIPAKINLPPIAAEAS